MRAYLTVLTITTDQHRMQSMMEALRQASHPAQPRAAPSSFSRRATSCAPPIRLRMSGVTAAAKLTECRNDYPTWITAEAYGKLAKWAKYGGNPTQLIWKEFKSSAMNDIPVYGSSWWWSIS